MDLYRAWRMRRFVRQRIREEQAVANQVAIILAMLDASPQLRKRLRQVLRVRGYET